MPKDVRWLYANIMQLLYKEFEYLQILVTPGDIDYIYIWCVCLYTYICIYNICMHIYVCVHIYT